MAQPLTALKAPNKLYKESVVMVHHYGGHKFSFKRTIEYLNSIGLDVYTFNLPVSDIKKLNGTPWHTRGLGYRYKWADAITEILDGIPGDKFVYSYSSPGSAALDAMSRRKFKDIRGWICDGGPFVNLQTGMTNLVREAGLFGGGFFKKRNLDGSLAQKIYTNTVGRILLNVWGSRNYEKEMAAYLHSIPKDFPIISFRATEDKLVYPEMIDGFFKLGPAPIQPVVIERVGHLLGFKDAPERYKTFLLDYFKRNGTAA